MDVCMYVCSMYVRMCIYCYFVFRVAYSIDDDHIFRHVWELVLDG
jgi:hypothetical protein